MVGTETSNVGFKEEAVGPPLRLGSAVGSRVKFVGCNGEGDFQGCGVGAVVERSYVGS